jgi:hypothetical protein
MLQVRYGWNGDLPASVETRHSGRMGLLKKLRQFDTSRSSVSNRHLFSEFSEAWNDTKPFRARLKSPRWMGRSPSPDPTASLFRLRARQPSSRLSAYWKQLAVRSRPRCIGSRSDSFSTRREGEAKSPGIRVDVGKPRAAGSAPGFRQAKPGGRGTWDPDGVRGRAPGSSVSLRWASNDDELDRRNPIRFCCRYICRTRTGNCMIARF